MSKDLKISINSKLLQALHGDVTPALEKKLGKIAATADLDTAAISAVRHSNDNPSLETDLAAKYKPRKKAISIRMDVDVLDWFKAQPGKYQKMINEACRHYMQVHQEKCKATEKI